jgi:hypothetical protein
MNYFSFLMCAHADHIDVYVCGREIGIIRDNKFHPTVLNANGTPIPKTFSMVEGASQRFSNQIEFKDFLLTAVSLIQMAEPPEEKPLTPEPPSI